MNSNEMLKMFEKELCEYTGAPYCVLTDSCTNSIFLCLEYKNRFGLIENGTVIEIPNQTYMSVPQQIILSGHIPKLKHIEWEKSYKLGNTNIIDSAVMFYRGMYQSGMRICCSFHSQKILNIDKGGCILLDDEEEYYYLRKLSWDGRDVYKDTDDDKDNIVGYHMNMTPSKAAQGLVVLSGLPDYHIMNNDGRWSNYHCLDTFDAFKGYV
jgi:dTDP-4-amino-4,6-dideoxygalactose transaminase